MEREGVGITVAENDVEGWVSAISMLLNDSDRVKEMGKNSLRLAREKFDINILADDLARVLRRIKERK